MLHFTTGANGAGKTLNTLKWVRERQVKENRPVCYNGRFDVVVDGELKSWKKIDIKNWHDEPDGTIFFVDEAHNDFPNRATGAVVPDYVKMLAEHRKRGFDFYLISQHPGNIDAFVRRLVGAPGWHRHLKRVAGGSSLVSCIQWDAVNPNCERNGSGATGEVTMIPFPKHVYGWYTSASLHTSKIKIPKAVYIFAVAAVGAGYLGWSGLNTMGLGKGDKAKQEQQKLAEQGGAVMPGMPSSGRPTPMTAEEWLQLRKARLQDFPHTAPAYDSVTAPTVAPYPAACIHARARDVCSCFTQQGTLMAAVSRPVCMQIVSNGYFVDWQQAQPSQLAQAQRVPVVPAPSPAPQSPPVVNVHLPPTQQAQPATWEQALATRNAQVRSTLGQ